MGLDFLDHGEVHDVAFMGAEEAQGGEKGFDVAEGHFGFDDTAGGVEPVSYTHLTLPTTERV